MGWTVYSRASSPAPGAEGRAEVERILTWHNAEVDVASSVVLASKVGSTWYAAVRMSGTGLRARHLYQPEPDGSVVVGVVILTSRKNGEWGYKDMDETSGPYHCDAPARILDALSPLSDGAGTDWPRRWREACRVKPLRPKPGQRVRLASPVSFDGTDVQDVTCTTYQTRRGQTRTCYHHPAVGLLRLRPEHLVGAAIV